MGWFAAARRKALRPERARATRLNGQIKRPSDVVGIFPKGTANTRLISAMLLELLMNGQHSAPAT
jgi:hypothetical protein